MKRYVLCLMLLLGLGTLRAQEPADSLPQRDEAVGEPAQTTGDVPADELWDRANTAPRRSTARFSTAVSAP